MSRKEIIMQQQHMSSIVIGMMVAMTTTVVVSVTICESFVEGTSSRSESKSTLLFCAVELDDGGDTGGGNCGVAWRGGGDALGGTCGSGNDDSGTRP